MYISEVSGHHCATIAIEKAIKSLSPGSEILNINAFNYTNPISEKIINRLYMGVIKATPKIWDYLYDNPKVVKNLEGIKNKIHKFNSPKLKRMFDNFNPDVVACAQAFPCGMVADYKTTYNSNLPLVAVLTDYIPHAYWVYDEVDNYIVPSEEITGRLMEKGVPFSKIKNFGIPFDHKFNVPVDKKEIISRLGLNPHQHTVLVMGGGQGLGPIKTIIRSMGKAKADFQQIIVCGTNKKLFRSMKRKFKKLHKKTLLFGYANNVNELMAVSDLVVTKPGGITTAEALSKKLPMLVVKPIPGQEANNTVYLTGKGAAVKVDKPKEVNLAIDDLLLNPEKLRNLRESASRISRPHASLDIARLLLNL